MTAIINRTDYFYDKGQAADQGQGHKKHPADYQMELIKSPTELALMKKGKMIEDSVQSWQRAELTDILLSSRKYEMGY